MIYELQGWATILTVVKGLAKFVDMSALLMIIYSTHLHCTCMQLALGLSITAAKLTFMSESGPVLLVPLRGVPHICFCIPCVFCIVGLVIMY